LRELDIEALLQVGHLKPELRENPEALGRAVYGALDLALDNEKCAIWGSAQGAPVARDAGNTRVSQRK
jgi:hypothetical protein